MERVIDRFMLGKILRLFLKIFLSLVAVLALLLGVIYTYNHWPRQIEPDLWTEEDLNLPPIPEENGWDLLPERGDLREEGFDFSIAKIEDYELKSAIRMFFRGEKSLADLAPYSEQISWLVQENKELLNRFEKILNAENFVDSGKGYFDQLRKGLFTFIKWHDIGRLFIIDKAFQEDWDTANLFFQKMFRTDLNWAYSARGFLSTRFAFACLKQNVALLTKMNEVHPIATLPNIEWEKISIQRAVMVEYLWSRESLDLIISKDLIISNEFKDEEEDLSFLRPLLFKLLGIMMQQAFYSEAATKKTLNNTFREFEKFAEHPSEIPEDADEKLSRQFNGVKSFPNYLGNKIVALVSISLAERIKETHTDKESMRQQVETLLNAQKETPNGEKISRETPAKEETIQNEAAPFSDQEPAEILKVQVAKKEYDEAVKNVEDLYVSIRIVPNFMDGKVSGFKILSVKSGSLFGKMGFKRGDELVSVNGREIEVKTLQLFFPLGNARTHYRLLREGQLIEIVVTYR